jgi:peptidoglycan/xylan/chitin deacetylase (PgdA/CDA1 family)
VIAALLLSSAIALTFDDLPGSGIPARDRCDAVALARWNLRLLAGLREHHAPAIGFVNSGRACVQRELPSILELWLRDHHELGNHTAHHIDAHAVSVDAFERDVIEGETPLRALLEQHGQRLTWFRYPMLHTGLTVPVRDEIATFLTKRGYRNAVVTMDSDEYLYNNAYAAAIDAGDIARQKRIASAYLQFMESIVSFYETRTVEVLGRSIPHVLLLHMSALNADRIDELLRIFERRGYRFITIDEAMRDPAYDSRDGYAGKAGLSWIHRWAVGKGMPIVWEPDAKIPADAR